MKDFQHHLYLGESKYGAVFVTIEYKIKHDGKQCLSITGVQGLKANGDASGSCGQIVETVRNDISSYASNFDAMTISRLADIWDRWHLNDMHPNCEHQREWKTDTRLDVQTYTRVGTLFDDIDALIRHKRASKKERALYELSKAVGHKLTVGSSEPYPAKAIELLIDENMLAPWKVESKLAGWVYPYEHPDGLLCKPCDVCGYRYGSQWLYEPVPEDVLAWLYQLPTSDRLPKCWTR
jgi:hypothetical protein